VGTLDPSSERVARAVGKALHEDGRKARQQPDADRELGRLLRTVRTIGPAPSTKRFPRVWALVAAATLTVTAAAVILVLVGVHPRAPSALTFTVDDLAPANGGAIATNPDHASEVLFSDGSTFDVDPGAHLRVESSSAAGAHLALLDGKVVAHVVHRATSSWGVWAGPFEVQVIGTRFSATWDRVRSRLVVELYEGGVQVVGGTLGQSVTVLAGQRFEAGTGPGDWMVTALKAPPVVAPPQAGAAPPVKAEDGEGVIAPPPDPSAKRAAAGAPGLDWPKLVQKADFETIVTQAGDMGIDRCLATCSLGDLRILADAARYSRHPDLAERCLLALRKRAPSEAATSAFLLARLDESRQRPQEALNWYVEHLREAPDGPYAAEALAGKMRLLQQLGDRPAAARTAREYLSRFPGGVDADTARKIEADAAVP
jgi:ferric-dicitrate binding protein FerR (iron transport regulator)